MKFLNFLSRMPIYRVENDARRLSVNMTRIIPVDELDIGMYVVQLDRPWLETPFLFQGFFIRDRDEINELKTYCKHVYVTHQDDVSTLETEPNTLSLPLPPVNGSNPQKRSFGLRSWFKRRKSPDAEAAVPEFKQTGVFYKATTTLKEEIHTATGVHKSAIVTVHDVMNNLRRSGSLDLGRIEETVTPMVDSVLRNPAALACLIRMQKVNNYLYHHSIATSIWATILGRQIGLQRGDIDIVAMGAILLDIGMTQLPKELLEKPGELTDKERDLMRRHVHFGLELIERAGDSDARVLEMIANHHERHNGTGYPQGLKGNAIPVFGRIASIVDAYDAMITSRPYAKLISSYDALRKLRVLADVEFQAEIVEQFTKAIGVFPTGTLVELSSGEIGIVTKQNRIRRLRPEVMIIMNANKQLLEHFQVIDLNDETVSSKTQHSLWIERGLPAGTHGIDPIEFYLD